MCQTSEIQRIVEYCKEHVLKVDHQCEHYQPEEQFCPQVYVEYCMGRKAVAEAGRSHGHLNVDPPCTFCQLRTPGSLDHISPCLIIIKASVETQEATDEECKNTGFWKYAILGQLFWEEHVADAGSAGDL
ncbi:hypothetical protein BST61_g204 [Cercospora zeina]